MGKYIFVVQSYVGRISDSVSRQDHVILLGVIAYSSNQKNPPHLKM